MIADEKYYSKDPFSLKVGHSVKRYSQTFQTHVNSNIASKDEVFFDPEIWQFHMVLINI